jgi:membrane protease YdiL (CAAX protease family)
VSRLPGAMIRGVEPVTPLTELVAARPRLDLRRTIGLFGIYVLAEHYLGRLVATFQGLGIGPSLLAVSVGSGVSLFIAARAQVPDGTVAEAFTSIGWRPASARQTGLAATIGTVLGLAVLGVSSLMPVESDSSLIAQSLSESELSRACTSVAVLFVAPPVEEFLFRGILYSGLRGRWSPTISGAVVTILFVLVHDWTAVSYPPAVIGIGAMAIMALVLRSSTGSLVPAIALHFAYNAAQIAAVYASV